MKQILDSNYNAVVDAYNFINYIAFTAIASTTSVADQGPYAEAKVFVVSSDVDVVLEIDDGTNVLEIPLWAKEYLKFYLEKGSKFTLTTLSVEANMHLMELG